ncbi:MAG: A/G-specific adenine glycosylase [Arcanobacterium sp.]|nr:A/G-specific adenine glycosylase [Arcanobacterium sp.]
MNHEFPTVEDAATAYEALTQWYEHNARELPWRQGELTPWGVLVCEVMSQQTPVARVAPIWTSWIHRWPTPHAMAQASPAEVLIAWDRLGYPRRALRLLECAQEVVAHYDGHLPQERSELLSLPGIGQYTADALLAFAFHQYSVVLDTNIRRVLARWHGAALPSAHPTAADRTTAAQFVPHDGHKAALWNQAIMEFGAVVCTAVRPQCTHCPVAELCGWRARGFPQAASGTGPAPQKFIGTQREARGKIMRVLRSKLGSSFTRAQLLSASGLPEERFTPALAALIHDGLADETRSGKLALPR